MSSDEAYRDPADYGPVVDDGGDESTTSCRVCGRLAMEHTRGRFSVYGVCPTDTVVRVDYCTCAGPCPGYPQHEEHCGWITAEEAGIE